ncbi:MAG TPA: hypothetical protein DGG95_07990 [Cytophagales bacterium]|jgi:hypothetical protein|nr:hypothetical protein [Cytophagales bacterium]
MENRGILVPNTNILYIIKIPETASEYLVDYKDAIILEFDKAYTEAQETIKAKTQSQIDLRDRILALENDMDALCKALYVGAITFAKDVANTYLKAKGEIE